MTNEIRLLRAFIEGVGCEIETIQQTTESGEIIHGQFDYVVTKKAKQSRPRKQHEYSPEFETLYKLKPHREGNSKPLAYKEYLAKINKKVPHSVIQAGTERYSAYIKATKSEFVYKLSNFIKNELYLEAWKIPEQATRLTLPRDNEKLEGFAKDNDLPQPSRGETYPEYRRRLERLINNDT